MATEEGPRLRPVITDVLIVHLATEGERISLARGAVRSLRRRDWKTNRFITTNRSRQGDRPLYEESAVASTTVDGRARLCV